MRHVLTDMHFHRDTVPATLPAMTPQYERYVLRGGKEGYERLSILARKTWPGTLALFERAGLTAGMHCLDLGCGGGAVALRMAKLVGPSGSVIGVDMDGVKLELARRDAAEQKLGNVEFRQSNVNDWNEPGAYDAVYSRLLLEHLSRPIDLLRRMWAGVRPGGLLMVEDSDFDGWCCDPPSEAFDFFVRTYIEVARRNGGDARMGRKLHRYFLEAGIPEPLLSVVQPLAREGETKTLPISTLEYSSEAIVSDGIASSEEVNEALTRLAEFIRNPRTIVSGPRIFQAWAKRSSPE
jgi:2-polyprenyl-3-methyl-5-hydroxy-6-metoxy-1,4-benzoquinol methylase